MPDPSPRWLLAGAYESREEEAFPGEKRKKRLSPEVRRVEQSHPGNGCVWRVMRS